MQDVRRVGGADDIEQSLSCHQREDENGVGRYYKYYTESELSFRRKDSGARQSAGGLLLRSTNRCLGQIGTVTCEKKKDLKFGDFPITPVNVLLL